MIRVFVLVLSMMVFVIPAFMQDNMPVHTAPISVTGAWARATAMADMDMDVAATEEPMQHAMDGVSAAYMTISNSYDTAIRLISARANITEAVEIHETSVENDIMRMREVVDGLEIPAGDIARLEPGGYHIMLMDLAEDLRLGDAIALTLVFDQLDGDGQPTGDPIEMLVGVPVLMDPPPATDFVITGQWARATAADRDADPGDGPFGPSAIYMTITNTGATADRLIAVQTDVANTVEIHETTLENDVMRMREMSDGLEIAAGAGVMLEPGGYHVMLMMLPENLYPGDAFVVTLVFASGTEITVGVPVRDFTMQM